MRKYFMAGEHYIKLLFRNSPKASSELCPKPSDDGFLWFHFWIFFHLWSWLTEQIKPICSNITSDSQTARLQQSTEKGMKCSPVRQVSLETTAYRDIFLFILFFPLPQPLSFRLSSSLTISFVFFLSFLPLVWPPSLFPPLAPVVLFCPHIPGTGSFSFSPRQPAISKCGSTWLCCPITGMTSVYLLPRHSLTLWWRLRCITGLCRINKKVLIFLGKFSFWLIRELATLVSGGCLCS